jgi:NAD(P)-dependent dehydrogenase (short-subunit alcohol dehydrogenase family)
VIDYRLRGKVALVTGASSGIGRATALAFARSGAKVLVADVQDQAGADTVAEITANGGDAFYQRCDVRKSEEVCAMVAATVTRWGRLDCAFNNAGVNLLGRDEFEDEHWDFGIDVNLSGVMRCIREEAAAMLRTGGGAIVNTSSINGIVGNPNQPAYVASKHGVVGLTRQAALKWAQSGIRVNAVCPGVIATPMTAPLAEVPEIKQMIDAMTPMGRFGQPEEIASAVVWLCSDAASFVTGHPLVIDGGATAF